ncbi:SusC/RagA family TonB-linked outer membrane protein [Parapedobacter koreensis]|uniref:TonB-linked outer membrane protein, SusC/RagA family n=1 Tax=Parapedobacter koreensis TaxID=332977 RepID=A0A1H7RQX1_9SPHI|nr:TonB-dependent receptor [Parapedobacter koreensis]SEL62409.1 TonB-linked outer membrane protein, SusC/RagA family [Parapedobacter koreensis]
MSKLMLRIMTTAMAGLGTFLALEAKCQNLRDIQVIWRSGTSSLGALLADFEKQSTISFYYDDEIGRRVITASITEQISLFDALTRIMKAQQLNMRQIKSLVALTTREQKRTEGQVAGCVTDEQGVPLAGASVAALGMGREVKADAEGKYSIALPEGSHVLEVSHVAFKTQRIGVVVKQAREVSANISLTADPGNLNEVVVVGYGTQRKADLTGAVGRVTAETLGQRQAISVEQGLAGRLAGVDVYTNSGRPGGRTRVRIRGYGSINASSDPLYVVDGVILTAGIETVNFNDVASVEVLKDASATAIYGTRGTNGVILITTKRGGAGGGLNYDSYVSVGRMVRKQRVLNAAEWLMVEDESYRNAAKFDSLGFAEGKYRNPLEKRKQYLVGNTAGRPELFFLDDAGIPRPLYDVDWQDAVTRNAISQQHNLAWSGGDDQANYGMFGGYTRENGIIRETSKEQFSFRGVLDKQLKKGLKIGATMAYSRNTEQRADELQGANNVTRQMIEMVPFIPYRYTDGTYGYRTDYEGLERGDNPLAQLHENVRRYKFNALNGNVYATMEVLPALAINTTFGTNIRNQHVPHFNSTQSDLYASGLGRNYAQIAASEDLFWQWTNRLMYQPKLDETHQLNAMLGVEYQRFNSLRWAATTQDMPDDFYWWNNLGAGATPQSPSSGTTAWQMASYFSRINYGYDNRYLLTLTGRYDGSSRFGSANKYAFFPSAALAWRVSEEPFLTDVASIHNLKLRASYGFTGNSEIGEYRSLANLGTASYIFNGTRSTGTLMATFANPDLKWEKTSQLNIGADLGLFNGRLAVEADFYVKHTSDLLLEAPIPASSGFVSMTRNIGSLKNSGIELTVSSVNTARGSFSWHTRFIGAYLKNEINALGVNNEDIVMDPLGAVILRVGESISSFYGFVAKGTWGTADAAEAARYGKKPGDLRYVDLNGDGQINNDDRKVLGKGIPDYYGSLVNTFRYRNLELMVELQYSYGNDVFKLSAQTAQDRVGTANSFATILQAWTPENQHTPYAQWRPNAAGYDSRVATNHLYEGSFIRGKNVMLSYALPASIVARGGLRNLRLFLSAQNVFLITKYDGYDPEVSTFDDAFSQGILFHDYPKARTLMLGMRLEL